MSGNALNPQCDQVGRQGGEQDEKRVLVACHSVEKYARRQQYRPFVFPCGKQEVHQHGDKHKADKIERCVRDVEQQNNSLRSRKIVVPIITHFLGQSYCFFRFF